MTRQKLLRVNSSAGSRLRRAARHAAVLLAAALALAPAAGARPNVVLIVTDDQRWDTLRHMPTVQAELVGKGVTFRNAFVVNPLCCPSRATIFTGRYSHTTGVWGNVAAGEHGGLTAFARHEGSTLPVWLDRAGYTTVLLGKYINGYEPERGDLYKPPGWDRWLAGASPSYFAPVLTDGTNAVRYPAGAYSTDVLAAEAARFIRQAGPEPFFLYLAPHAPHFGDGDGTFSVEAAPRHVGTHRFGPLEKPSVNEPNVDDKPDYIRSRAPIDPAKLTELRNEQLDSLLAVDEALGGILAALTETDKLADTLIIYTSDNGYSWGEHRWAGKQVPYEESLRVPMVARWDRLGVAPYREERPVLNIDLPTTILAAAGASATGLEGRDMVRLARDPAVRWRSSFLFEQFNPPGAPPGYCGFRTTGWKYVQYATGFEELYDLQADPLERANVAARHPQLVSSFRDRVRASACRPPGFQPVR